MHVVLNTAKSSNFIMGNFIVILELSSSLFYHFTKFSIGDNFVIIFLIAIVGEVILFL